MMTRLTIRLFTILAYPFLMVIRFIVGIATIFMALIRIPIGLLRFAKEILLCLILVSGAYVCYKTIPSVKNTIDTPINYVSEGFVKASEGVVTYTPKPVKNLTNTVLVKTGIKKIPKTRLQRILELPKIVFDYLKTAFKTASSTFFKKVGNNFLDFVTRPLFIISMVLILYLKWKGIVFITFKR